MFGKTILFHFLIVKAFHMEDRQGRRSGTKVPRRRQELNNSLQIQLLKEGTVKFRGEIRCNFDERNSNVVES